MWQTEDVGLNLSIDNNIQTMDSRPVERGVTEHTEEKVTDDSDVSAVTEHFAQDTAGLS